MLAGVLDKEASRIGSEMKDKLTLPLPSMIGDGLRMPSTRESRADAHFASIGTA